MKKVHYLVIWQLGDNKQSRKHTPVEVKYSVSKIPSAEEKYNQILHAVRNENIYIDSINSINVVGIYIL